MATSAVTQNVNVDLNTGKSIPTAYTHQNDTARTFIFDMHNGGLPYTMTGNTVKFAYKSPIVNGQYTVITGSGMASGTVSGNKVTVTLPSEYTAISGVGMLTMIITPSSGTIRPVNIRLVVQKSADGADVVAGASDFPTTLEEIADNWYDENIADWLNEHIETIFDADAFGTAIDTWLDDHPEATTTVQDHSLTMDKLVIGTLGYVTPEMYGAKGDGTTDDTEAIQAAFNSGKPVRFNSVTYFCGGELSLVDNLSAMALANATIKFASTDGTALISGSYLSSISFERITFDFGEQDNSKYGLSILNSENICFEKCNLKNGLGYATRLNNSNGIKFDKCGFYDIDGVAGNPGGAIYGQNMVDLTITDCFCDNVDDHFAYLAGVDLCSNIIIDGNIVKNSGNSSLTSGAAVAVYSNSQNVTITNNVISGCRTGIQVSNYGSYSTVPSDVIIADNKIDDSVLDGMSVIGLSNAFIQRLYCSNNIINNSGQDGAHFRYCRNISVDNMSVNEATRSGVEWSYVHYSQLDSIIVNNADANGIIIGNSGDCNYNSFSSLTAYHSGTGTYGIYLRQGTGNKLVSYIANGYSVNFANAMTNTMVLNDTAGKWASNENQSFTGTSIAYAPTRDGFVTAENDVSSNDARYITVTDTTAGRVVGSAFTSGGVRTAVSFFVIGGHSYTIARNESTKSLNVMFNCLY